jgi:hypothetical protein
MRGAIYPILCKPCIHASKRTTRIAVYVLKVAPDAQGLVHRALPALLLMADFSLRLLAVAREIHSIISL